VARFQITLVTPDAQHRFECDEDEYILDAAEDSGGVDDLPWGCRSGSCASCVGRVKSGSVDQGEQNALDDAQEASGYVLLCSALPTEDCVIETHKFDEI